MKKDKRFTPPLKNSDNLATFSLRQILCSISCIAIALASIGCSSVSAQNQETTDQDVQQISSFSNYSWDTSYNDIYSAEISSEMKENINFQRDESDGLTMLALLNQEVAGYSGITSSYIFSDEKLVAGNYALDIDDEVFEDLNDKITEIYGTPYIIKDSTGWGNLAVWIDDSKNILTLSEILDVTYFEADSPLLATLNDQFVEFHDFDLLNEIKKYNNTDGLSQTVPDSSNPLLNAQINTSPVKSGDNSKTLGTYAYINISKSILKAVTMDQFTEFAQAIVDNSGYNWVSIICEDGTGICFSGSDIYYPSYGKLDADGAITDGYGDITWDFDTNTYSYTPRQ